MFGNASTTNSSGVNIVGASATTEINFSCYTRIEFLIFMGFIILVVLTFITLFICVFLLHDRCCSPGNKSRRGANGIHHHRRVHSGQNFTPCKWWMNRSEDYERADEQNENLAHNLSELFHDRVGKLRRESQTGANVKEFMQRLIPADECNGAGRVGYAATGPTKMFTVNEKKLLISVPRSNVTLYGS